MNLSERLARWRVDPRPVFVIDSVGTVTSAVLLRLVLPFGAEMFGTTREALRTLAVFPVIYAAIDVACVVEAGDGMVQDFVWKSTGPTRNAIAVGPQVGNHTHG
jgi:hypothetical protein